MLTGSLLVHCCNSNNKFLLLKLKVNHIFLPDNKSILKVNLMCTTTCVSSIRIVRDSSAVRPFFVRLAGAVVRRQRNLGIV
jgi:hypothetical protein